MNENMQIIDIHKLNTNGILNFNIYCITLDNQEKIEIFISLYDDVHLTVATGHFREMKAFRMFILDVLLKSKLFKDRIRLISHNREKISLRCNDGGEKVSLFEEALLKEQTS